MTESRLRRLPPLGVRARLTIVAVVVVGVVLVIGAVLLLELAEQRVEDTIADGAGARASSLVTVAEAGALEDPLSGSDPDFLAQVVVGTEVVAADRIIAGIPPLVGTTPAVGERLALTSDDLLEPFETLGLEDEGPYRVVVVGFDDGERTGRVIVAASLEPAVQARRAVRPILGIGLPVLLVVVAVTTWVLAGRALRPVELMRRDAMEISAVDLGRRLTLPAAADEVHQLAVSLNAMLQRLHDAIERQRRFVSDASHELRSPLAAIRTMVEVTLDEPDPQRRARATEDLAGEIDRLERLIADLLVLAAEDEGTRHRPGIAVDLDQVVGRIASDAGLRHGARIITDGIAPAVVSGDPDRLERLVRNLIDNACRHATSQVWVDTHEEGESVMLRVSDDGPGIDPADRDRVFERFVRLDDSRSRDGGGAGLGLPVVRSVADAHNATVAFVDPLHGGATVEVEFPSAAAAT